MIKIPIDNIGITLVGHLQIERCSNRQFFAFEKNNSRCILSDTIFQVEHEGLYVG